MMLRTKHLGCGGTLYVPLGITEAQENAANAKEDAALLKCDRCHTCVLDDTSSTRPDRYRVKEIPDQSVFEVTK